MKGMYKYRFFAGVAAVGLILTSVWHVADADKYLRYSDSEADFAESVRETDTLKSETGHLSPTSLPPIPEPLNEEGRTRWSEYWKDMTPEEQLVYGNWVRPEGPLRVGIQPGHWELESVPEELEGLQASSGAVGGGYTEQEVVFKIAEEVKRQLEEAGVMVDFIPATVPVDYVADAFVSIHADGSTDTSVSGYKIAPPRRDFSGQAGRLVDALYAAYGEATELPVETSITRRMSGYYAFNWRRYDHALHPQTPAAIVETGFMTNASDRALLVNQPEVVATGIANGILTFLGR